MSSSTFTTTMLFLFVVATLSGRLSADETEYTQHIQPVLKHRCYACHGALKQEAGLRLDTGALAREGSENGAVLNVPEVDKSWLIERLTSEDPEIRMPPDGKPLTQDEVQHFRNWISMGAKSPPDEVPESDPRDHWAFRVPEKPEVSITTDDRWSANEIDHFIRRRHLALGLKPAPDASPERLLRRLTLDLIGIPPTPSQVKEFVEDPTPARYEQVIDRLLASPHYGERWGRHWMDVWRYSDWYGRRQQNDVRNSAPQIWRWREWIVNSLNDDKSYARMVQEMLAADEIAADDDSTWPATGYLIRNYYSLNPNEWMRHNVEYTGKAFLGLTFNCAHCHDHKYDPISHEDYFRMRAFFEPMGIRQDQVAGGPEPPPFEPYKYSGSRKVVRTGMVRIFDEKSDAETWFYTGGDERNKIKDRGSIAPGVPSFLNVPFEGVAPVSLPMSGWYPGSRSNLQAALLKERDTEIFSAETALESARHTNVDTSKLTADLTLAQSNFETAMLAARQNGEQGALTGKQSLMMDATSGRRIVQHGLANLKSLPHNTGIDFQLKILKDGHFNFQLARDTSKGLTALYLGFVNGSIKAYRPGTFKEFVIGQYADGHLSETFRVSLSLHPDQDSVTVDISTAADSSSKTIVADAQIALNGWNPTVNQHQPFTFDCRPETRVLIDNVTVSAGDQRFHWDFESPRFQDGDDIHGVQGWVVHASSSESGISTVSSVAGCQSASKQHQQLIAAKHALVAATTHVHAAELRLDAARKSAAGLRATIAADTAIREEEDEDVIQALSHAAYTAQLVAKQAQLNWQILDKELTLTEARTDSDDTKEQKTKIKKLLQELKSARTELTSVIAQSTQLPRSADYEKLSPVTSSESTGRRSALAKWITHRQNPLTARVAVNHMWLRHFHSPIVETVYDFGRNGKPPSYPKLLDWLAVELMENNWSMKHVHRLMVTSRTYRMTASARNHEGNLFIDSENEAYWRMNSGRMEAEVVRDSVLSIAGSLDDKIGGEVLPNTTALTSNRRSLYYEIYPEDGGNNALAQIFDGPDPGECFRRTSTVLPQQALALSNSRIIHKAAKEIATQLTTLAGKNADAFVNEAFLRILSRRPGKMELKTAREFLAHSQNNGSADRALESLIRVLFNHNDFVTIR